MLCSSPLFDPTEFFIQEKGFHSSLLTWATKSPSPGGSFGLGSALHKEKELFSKELSILFDLCKIVQVNLQALNLNLPLQLSHLHILTRHSRETLKGMSGWMGGGREKKSIIPIPLKVQIASGFPSIDLLLTPLDYTWDCSAVLTTGPLYLLLGLVFSFLRLSEHLCHQ